MYLKHRLNYKMKLRDKVALIILLILINSFFIFKSIKKSITPILVRLSTSEINKLTSSIVNEATKKFVSVGNVDNLYEVVKNSEEEILMINYNTILVNKYLSDLVSSIEEDILSIEQGDIGIKYSQNGSGNIIYYIPFSSISNIPVISTLGPAIPFKVSLVGHVSGNIVTELEEYGINNSILKVSAKLLVEQSVILPFTSEIVSKEFIVPLVVKMVNGRIPSVYGGNIVSNSPLVNTSN